MKVSKVTTDLNEAKLHDPTWANYPANAYNKFWLITEVIKMSKDDFVEYIGNVNVTKINDQVLKTVQKLFVKYMFKKHG